MATQTAQLTRTRVGQRLSFRQWRRLREMLLGYGLLAPAIILLVVFEFYPIFYGLYISACRWRIGLGCVEFIGIDNFTRAFGDIDWWESVLTTTTYALISVPVQLGLGLFIAYLLFQNIRGKEFFRIMFFVPYITATVASAAVWAYLYSPDKGLINTLAKWFGLPTLRWLGEAKGIFTIMANGIGVTDWPTWAAGPSLALISVLIYTTWVFVGYDIAIFLAGLGNIPTELYEAARIDGASGWSLFRHITLPLLSPTIFFLLILTVIGVFKAFNHIFIMTGGGPNDTTRVSSIYIFDQLLQPARYGYSAALSIFLGALILLITIIQNRVAGSRVVYD
jgi:multiple sugar transport system permease protein